MNSDASRIAALVGTVLLCLALTFGVVVTLAGKSDAASMEYTITQLNRPGELMYSIGNLLSSEDGALGNFENAKWTAISEFSYKYLIGRREVWYRMPLQLVRSEEPAILLSTRYIHGIELYLDRQCIYRFGSFTAEGLSQNPPNQFLPHIVPLPDNFHKSTLQQPFLYVRKFYGKFPLESILGDIYTGPLNQIIAMARSAVMYTELFENSMGAVFLFIGCVSLGIFFFRWKFQYYPFLSFGFFLVCAGTHYLHGHIAHFMGLPPVASFYLNFFSNTLLPVGIIALFNQLIYNSMQRIIRFLWQFHIGFIAVWAVLIWVYLPIVELFATTINILGLVYLCFSLVILLKARAQKYSKVLLIAFLLFFLIALVDDLRWLIVFKTGDGEHYYGIGVILLIFAFSYILIDHYKETAKKAQNYALKLESNERKMLQLERENLQSRFEALKSQLNPHFLFNTFGTLISLIEKSQADAVHFVEELSRVYRHLLQTQNRKLVSLRSELDFIDSYSYLVAKRFGEKVTISVTVEERFADRMVPPLSLQLLIENAIKHNIISARKPLKITLGIDCEDFLVVKNNKQKKTVLEHPTKVGLANLKHRYQFFTDRTIEVVNDRCWFSVKIPLLKKRPYEVA